MQVVISLSQPGANEASGPSWSDPPHAARATAAKATATPLLTRSTLREDTLRPIWGEWSSAGRFAGANCKKDGQGQGQDRHDAQGGRHPGRGRHPAADQGAQEKAERDRAGVETEHGALRFGWRLKSD